MFCSYLKSSEQRRSEEAIGTVPDLYQYGARGPVGISSEPKSPKMQFLVVKNLNYPSIIS
jgi:hypothetical protein